jgi:hypothetical protein
MRCIHPLPEDALVKRTQPPLDVRGSRRKRRRVFAEGRQRAAAVFGRKQFVYERSEQLDGRGARQSFFEVLDAADASVGYHEYGYSYVFGAAASIFKMSGGLPPDRRVTVRTAPSSRYCCVCEGRPRKTAQR